MAPIKLGYWNIRGLAQPIRMALEVGGLQYEEKRYNYGPPPTFDRSEWFNEKFNLGLDFPNLPYLIDGEHKIVQSMVILRYIARKCGLVGQTEKEQISSEIVEQQVGDWWRMFTKMCYSPGFEENKKEYLAALPGIVKNFSDYLGNRKFFAGNRLTYADFLAYEMIFQNYIFCKEAFANAKNLVDFMKTVEDVPQIKAYMASDRYIKWPFNGDMANFGSRHQKCPF